MGTTILAAFVLSLIYKYQQLSVVRTSSSGTLPRELGCDILDHLALSRSVNSGPCGDESPGESWELSRELSKLEHPFQRERAECVCVC